jgi:hypothetical protein
VCQELCQFVAFLNQVWAGERMPEYTPPDRLPANSSWPPPSHADACQQVLTATVTALLHGRIRPRQMYWHEALHQCFSAS